MKSKILLADDSITIQKVVNLTFADEGIEVVTVSNGDMAERRMQEVNPDLVLADIFMPGKNGYELCQFVKESPQFRNVPVVLLVGAFEPFDQSEAKRVRADGHLTKPFESRVLVETVRNLIQTSQASKAASQQEYKRPPDTRPLNLPAIDQAAILAESLSRDEGVREAFGGSEKDILQAAGSGPETAPPLSIDYNGIWQSNQPGPADTLGSTDEHGYGTDRVVGDTSAEDRTTASQTPALDYPFGDATFEIADSQAAASAVTGSPEGFSSPEILALDLEDQDVRHFSAGETVEEGQDAAAVYFSTVDEGAAAGHVMAYNDDPYGQDPPTFEIESRSAGDLDLVDTSRGRTTAPLEPEPLQEMNQSLFYGSTNPAEEIAVALPASGDGVNHSGSERIRDEPAYAPALLVAANPTVAVAHPVADDDPLGDVLSDVQRFDVEPPVSQQSEPIYAHPYIPEGMPAELTLDAGRPEAVAPHDDSSPSGEYLNSETEGSRWSEPQDVPHPAAATFTSSEMWAQAEAHFSPVDVGDVPQPLVEPIVHTWEEPASHTGSQTSDAHETGFDITPDTLAESGFDIVQESALRGTIRGEFRARTERMQAAKVFDSGDRAAQSEMASGDVDEIVRRVVQQMSDDLVREIAWEVVPDCVERIIEKLARESLAKRA
jgi:CheY-like chemotaxis protein